MRAAQFRFAHAAADAAATMGAAVTTSAAHVNGRNLDANTA
jgi:hypothetical protein